MPEAPLILIRAAAVRDAMQVDARPGAVMVRAGRIIAAGDEAEVVRQAGKADRVIDESDSLLLPAMVNGHAHLDLTNLPRWPYGGNFIDWVRGIIQCRTEDETEITAAVNTGLRLSREGGVGLLVDIAGSAAAMRARLLATENHIAGASFLEVLGFGQRGIAAGIEAHARLMELHACADDAGKDDVHLSLQPHAPYSTGSEVYDCVDAYYNLATTHLAETREEDQFIREAAGPFADLLRKMGRWDDSIRARGISPVQYLRHHLIEGAGHWIVAHCNYVDDEDIRTLAWSQTTVAYCPVASDYFLHRGHRYRDMIAAGINVCLGTDSIVCQPPEEAQPMSILAQMRHLYRRDGTDPQLLLTMGTINGASACGGASAVLGGERTATLSAHQPANIIAVRIDVSDAADPLMQVMRNREPVRRIGIE